MDFLQFIIKLITLVIISSSCLIKKEKYKEGQNGCNREASS
jgi:hypothetical protein